MPNHQLKLVGLRFEKLVVVKAAGKSGKAITWQCLCDCGRLSVVVGFRLKSGKTKSCGCLRAESMSRIATKHGLSNHPAYNSWTRMMSRCFDPTNNRFHRYGGRGITVCKSWQNAARFIADMGDSYFDGASIERINNDKGYRPNNCKWATTLEQSRNKSNTKLRTETVQFAKALYATNSFTQAEVGALLGVSRDCIKHVLRNSR